MNFYMDLYMVALFFVLSPGVLLTLPKGGSRLMVAAVHAVVFATIYHFAGPMVWKLTKDM
jgi:hypothetical protein